MRGLDESDESDAEEISNAAPMMFVEQPPRLDGRSASDVLQLLQALIDTIEDDYAEVLERYWIDEASRLRDAWETDEHEQQDGDGDDGGQLALALTAPDNF